MGKSYVVMRYREDGYEALSEGTVEKVFSSKAEAESYLKQQTQDPTMGDKLSIEIREMQG